MSILTHIVSFIGGLLLAVGFIFSPTAPDQLGATNLIAGHSYTLAGAGLSSSATSITLSSLTIKQTGQPIQDSDLSDTFYLTLEPGNTSRQELVSCTTVGANTGGAVSLSGCTRGLSPISPYTASSSLRFSHAGGTTVIFSDPPQVFNEFAALQNNAVISGQWQFTTLPTSSVACTTGNQLCNKSYVDGISVQGAATSTFENMGILQLATAAQIAASTASSSVGQPQGGAPLVISPKFATSTPGTLCTGSIWNCIPVGNLSGKISQLWFDLTQHFTFSSLFATVASTTNATTTNFTITNKLIASGASATSTFAGNIDVAGNATTTNLFAGGAAYLGIIATSSAASTGPTGDAGTGSATAFCPAGYSVLGGGFQIEGITNVYLTANYSPNTTSWAAAVICRNGGGCSANTIIATAVCARIK